MNLSVCVPYLHTNNLTMASTGLCVSNFNTIKFYHERRIRRSSGKVLSMNKGFNDGVRRDLRVPFVGGNQEWEEEISTLRRRFELAFPRSGRGRLVATKVTPFQKEHERQAPPPDLASYIYRERIIYLGMPIYSAVVELMLAELFYLAQCDSEKPAYMYINSTGCTKDGRIFTSEFVAHSLYDLMQVLPFPIYTICVGNAWGEAALLLAAGTKGYRAALPSANIMIKEPITMCQGQASDIELAREEIKDSKETLVKLLAESTGNSEEKIAQDIRRPKYFSPQAAIEYGLIDKVFYPEGRKGARGYSQPKIPDLI